MKPLLASWPEKKRALAFLPFAAGVFLVAFIVLALATQHFFLTMLLSPALGVGGAYALVGFPELRRKDGRPLVDPRVKPYLFFLLAPLFSLLLYPVLGIALTELRLPAAWLAYLSMFLAAGLGFTGAYFLVGFPNLRQNAREAYAKLPPERRPFLFFPLFVVFFLLAYLAVGVATTRLMGRVASNPATLLNVQVLVLLPLSLLVAGALAYLLVGFPKPNRPLTQLLPKVTGRHRPQYFLATILVLGIPFTVALGAFLTAFSKSGPLRILLPAELVLPLAVALGYAMSFGLAVLVWGTPSRWKRFDDYEPGLPPRMRMPVFGALALVVWAAVTILFGLVGLDIFWGLLAGAFLGIFVFLALSGLATRIAARRHEPTLLPELPDGLKPLVLFPTWFVVAGLLFAVLTYALPRIVALNAVISFVVGLAVAFFLVEQPLWKDLQEERRREKEKRKAWEARRKQALDELDDAKPGA